MNSVVMLTVSMVTVTIITCGRDGIFVAVDDIAIF